MVVHWLDSLLGMPDAAAIAALARPYASYDAYIWGPDAYLAAVRDALGRLGVPSPRVHVERFLAWRRIPSKKRRWLVAWPQRCRSRWTARRRGCRGAGTRLLDILIGARLDTPYPCRQGICGACACQLTGGEVEMAHNQVLEAADGHILACQAVPLTPDVSVTY